MADGGFSDEDLRLWFPKDRKPEPDTFEIGLVLAGAASSGVYIAGVVDFLIEALDAWTAAKRADIAAGRTRENATVPHHKVVIRIITGASAGGMNAAIAAAALNRVFPPARADSPDAVLARNPFYDAWVRRIGIDHLLDEVDLGSEVRSLLNCRVLEEIVDSVLAGTGPAAEPENRDWLANPLPVMLTVTNLRGVPYAVLFRGEGAPGHGMTVHRDHAGFAVSGLSARPPEPLSPEFRRLPADRAAAEWRHLGDAALATGAFPLALRPRVLSRRRQDYDFRHPAYDEGDHVSFGPPAWPEAEGDDYRYLCVDGGAMNNEPFDLAHMALAGLYGSNPRKGVEADRAVVMVDPFVDPATSGPAQDVSIAAAAGALVTAYKDQARYSPGDWALIQSGEVYSRFLIAPSRGEVDGAGALATGGLMAFMGFMSADYRRHDYLLGRRNCQRFLQTVLTLPKDNRLFDRWSDAARRDYADVTDSSHLQVIPCVGAASIPEPRPAWPRGKFSPGADLSEKIASRTRAVTGQLLAAQLKSLPPLVRPIARLYLAPMVAMARKRIVRSLQDAIRNETKRIDLAFPD